jgi:pimeloyl-ACP methyl ester carboxylesterase
LRANPAAFVIGAVVFAGVPFELPAPTGALPIGTTSWQVTEGPRRIGVHAWYPAASAGREAAPYLRDGVAGVRGFAAAIEGPSSLFDDVATVRTHATVDPPLAPQPALLPLLLFSHGYTAEPSAYTALLEDLASHGYAVLSIVHPYERGEAVRVIAEWTSEDATMAAITGTADEAEQMRLMRGYLSAVPLSTAVVSQWVDDTRLVLGRLPRLSPNTAAGRVAARIDASRIGVLGHSMGGVVAAQFCLEDRQCRAGLNLDGSPQYGSVVDGELRRPFMMVYSSRLERAGANDIIYRRAASPYYRVQVNGTLHLDFTDMVFWPPLRDRKVFGAIAPVRATEITRAIVREYFDQELRGQPSALLAGDQRVPELTVAKFHRDPL